MITPERKLEIEKINSSAIKHRVGIVNELLAEITRLNKALDQAITLSEMDISDINGRIWCDERSINATSCPELVEELKRRK